MPTDGKTKHAPVTRRRMLALLGLAAGAAYAAPVLLQLGEARASSFSGGRGGRGSRGSYSRPSYSGGRRRRTRHGGPRRSVSFSRS